MWTAEEVVDALRERDELWEPAPGSVGLRGNALRILRALEERIMRLAAEGTGEEWEVTGGIPLEVLHRADYFASFPQWLTLASHLEGVSAMECVVSADDPMHAIGESNVRPSSALPPAACYHVYPNLAGRILEGPRVITLQSRCWRREAEGVQPLARGWSFTMREVVAIGSREEIDRFRRRMMERVGEFAEELGLDYGMEVATDPFFSPAARGKALLQRVKELKHELRLPIGEGRTIAAASFNDHETFFAERFDIRLRDGAAASTGCVAFGLERWLLAFLVAHGPDAVLWPQLPEPVGAEENYHD